MRIGQKVKVIASIGNPSYFGKIGIITEITANIYKVVFNNGKENSVQFYYKINLSLVNEPGNIDSGAYWFRRKGSNTWILVEIDKHFWAYFIGDDYIMDLIDLDGDFIEIPILEVE